MTNPVISKVLGSSINYSYPNHQKIRKPYIEGNFTPSDAELVEAMHERDEAYLDFIREREEAWSKPIPEGIYRCISAPGSSIHLASNDTEHVTATAMILGKPWGGEDALQAGRLVTRTWSSEEFMKERKVFLYCALYNTNKGHEDFQTWAFKGVMQYHRHGMSAPPMPHGIVFDAHVKPDGTFDCIIPLDPNKADRARLHWFHPKQMAAMGLDPFAGTEWQFAKPGSIYPAGWDTEINHSQLIFVDDRQHAGKHGNIEDTFVANNTQIEPVRLIVGDYAVAGRNLVIDTKASFDELGSQLCNSDKRARLDELIKTIQRAVWLDARLVILVEDEMSVNEEAFTEYQHPYISWLNGAKFASMLHILERDFKGYLLFDSVNPTYTGQVIIDALLGYDDPYSFMHNR